MEQARRNLRFASMFPVLIGGAVACGGSGASVHGITDFEAKDAVYLSVDDSRATDNRNIILLISDTENLCERLANGESFAGRSKLAIKSRWTGSAHFSFMRFDNECEVEQHEDTGQGWIQIDQANQKVQGSFAFVADGANVTGDVVAANCRMPDNSSFACHPSH